MFEPMELTNDAVIKVIGVGGGGGNAVEHMVRERIEGVEFFAVNATVLARDTARASELMRQHLLTPIPIIQQAMAGN